MNMKKHNKNSRTSIEPILVIRGTECFFFLFFPHHRKTDNTATIHARLAMLCCSDCKVQKSRRRLTVGSMDAEREPSMVGCSADQSGGGGGGGGVFHCFSPFYS